MTGKYDRDPKQDDIRTRVIDADPGAADSGGAPDRSIEHKLATGETIAVTPRPGYVGHNKKDLTTTMRLAYRRTTGFYRSHTEECGAALAAVLLVGGAIAAILYTRRCDRDDDADRDSSHELRLGGSEESDQFYQKYVKESGIDKIYPAKSKASKTAGKADKPLKSKVKAAKKPAKKWILKKR